MKSEENSPYADDEIKIYVDEGDERDEIKKSENLNEDKKQLVGDSDDETDGSARPKDESQENPFLTGPGALQFQQFCSSLFYPGFQSQLARFPFMCGKDNFPIPSPMSMGYPLPPSAHPGLFPLYPHNMSKWAAFPRFPILPNGLPGSPLLPGSPVPPFMPIPGLTSPPLNHLNKIPHPMMEAHEESFRGSMFGHHLNGLNHSDHHFFPNTSYTQQKAPPKKPAIKKPLNAFMIFMKENRPAVIAKYKTKESASINQILGREWHALGREAQQEYYDMAKKEKESHALRYPGWSARDNYAMNSKKKKHKIGHSESASSGSDSPRCNVLKHPPKSCNSLELL